MGSIFVSDPIPFPGTFTPDPIVLRKKIKSWSENYNKDDPRTWPLLDDAYGLSKWGFEAKNLAPSGVAYCSSMVQSFNECRGARIPKLAKKARFRLYPFNFDQDGNERNEIGLLETEFELWMLMVHGQGWESKFAPLRRHAHESPINKAGTDHRSPKTLFESIMENLGEQKTASSSTFTLQNELKDIKKELQRVTDERKSEREEYKQHTEVLQATIDELKLESQQAESEWKQDLKKEIDLRKKAEREKRTERFLCEIAENRRKEADVVTEAAKTTSDKALRELEDVIKVKERLENQITELKKERDVALKETEKLKAERNNALKEKEEAADQIKQIWKEMQKRSMPDQRAERVKREADDCSSGQGNAKRTKM